MFNVRYYPDVDEALLAEMAGRLYDTYSYPRIEFNKREYLERVLLEGSSGSMFMCFEGDTPVGGITVSDSMYDMHFNGTGKHVLNFVVLPHKNPAKIVRLLLNELRTTLIRGGKDTWYSTTHRRDFYTLTTKYWRINNSV